MPSKKIPHDYWILLCARFNGKVYIDDNSLIKHRIHDNNACGIANSFIERIKKFYKFYIKSRVCYDEAVSYAIELYGTSSFDEQLNEFLKDFVNYKSGIMGKLKLCLNKSFKFFKIKGRLINYFLIIINKL